MKKVVTKHDGSTIVGVIGFAASAIVATLAAISFCATKICEKLM